MVGACHSQSSGLCCPSPPPGCSQLVGLVPDSTCGRSVPGLGRGGLDRLGPAQPLPAMVASLGPWLWSVEQEPPQLTAPHYPGSRLVHLTWSHRALEWITSHQRDASAVCSPSRPQHRAPAGAASPTGPRAGWLLCLRGAQPHLGHDPAEPAAARRDVCDASSEGDTWPHPINPRRRLGCVVG